MTLEIITLSTVSYKMFAFLGVLGFLVVIHFLNKYRKPYKWNNYRFELNLLILLPVFWIYLGIAFGIVKLIDKDLAIGGLIIIYWSALMLTPIYFAVIIILLILRFIRIKFIGK